ncbi:MAG: tRNA lysidine(34) synthetase TilS [Caldimonas sp.]
MPAAVVAVAFSGGRDSTALLHATLAAATPFGLTVVALHVHHGLSPNADAWVDWCASRCRRWARQGLPVTFAAERLEGGPGAGDSVEAWARRARYRALRAMAIAHGADLVLLGHHRQDQAETFLLQALRGAGAAGLAAMPRLARRQGVSWARPWLAQPRAAIESYVRRHRLAYLDDDTNADCRFARNRLRAAVWPALVGAFGDAEQCLSGAARRLAEASALLDECATEDLARIAGDASSLDVAGWLALSPARRGNALRAWLRAVVGDAVPASLGERLVVELPRAPNGRWPTPAGELRRHRGRLHHVAGAPTGPPIGPAVELDLSRVGDYVLPGWQGSLRVRRVAEHGIALSTASSLEVRGRSGGERFQPGLQRPARGLKKQYQAAGVPEWQRAGPLLFAEGVVAFVPGLGIDARVVAAPGRAQVALEWLPLHASLDV